MDQLTLDTESDFTVTVIDYETGINHKIKVIQGSSGVGIKVQFLSIVILIFQRF